MGSPSSSTPNSSGDESQQSDKMPRPNPNTNTVPKGFHPKRPELDLSAILSPDQLKQLQVLMHSVLDDMQRTLRDNFDDLEPSSCTPDTGIQLAPPMVLSVPNPRSEKYRHMYGDIGMPEQAPDFQNRDELRDIMKPVAPLTTPKGPKPTLTLPRSMEEATRLSNKTPKEIVVGRMSEMRRECLAHFGKWRMHVSRRVNDLVVKGGGTGGHAVRRGHTQLRGNGRRVGRGAGVRLARHPGPKSTDADLQKAVATSYTKLFTLLKEWGKEKRAIILHSMMLLVIGLDQYTAYSRICIIKLAIALEIPIFVLQQDEFRLAQALAHIVKDIPAEEIAQKRAEEGKPTKRWRNSAGPSTAAGPATLAEPLVAAGIGTVFGGDGLAVQPTANLLGGLGASDSTVPVGTLFGLYGSRSGGKTMDAYAKDVQDFALVPMYGDDKPELIDPKDVAAECRRMRVTIGVNGWVTKNEGFRHPSHLVDQQNEVYALRWELDALTKIYSGMLGITTNAAWSESRKEFADRSVFASLRKSHWPEGLLKSSKVIDNAWTVAFVRADKAGQCLADVLLNKIQGERAVSLIGYSTGARLIYSCLMQLAEKRAFGVIENVILLGCPCPSDVPAWSSLRSVVAGRLINVYSKNDYLLGFLYRHCAWEFGLAGLQKIEGVPRIENIDVSDEVSNHLQYQFLVGKMLRQTGWEDVNAEQADKDAEKMGVMMKEQAKLDQQRDERAAWEAKRLQEATPASQTKPQGSLAENPAPKPSGPKPKAPAKNARSQNSKENRRPGRGGV